MFLRSCPKNTEKNDCWALNVLGYWLNEHNKRPEVEVCPEDFIEKDDPELLNKWLSLFVIEVRKADGSHYPPATINLILCGLQRHMRCHNKSPVNIFTKHDTHFEVFVVQWSRSTNNYTVKVLGVKSSMLL